MKMLFYINTLSHGGAERVFSNLANNFAEAKHEVYFLTSFRCDNEYQLYESIKRFSIEDEPKRHTFIWRNIKRISALREIIKTVKPGIVLTTSPETNVRAILACMLIRAKIKKVILLITAPEREYKSPFLRGICKILYHYADTIVCQTPEQKLWFPGVIQERCVLLFNQVQGEFFYLSPQGERKNIVSVGRLVYEKKFDILIRSFALISNQTNDHLIIYGEGPLRSELEKLIVELGLLNRVVLPGIINNVADAIVNARMFILSSEVEGLPNALMEAMALGLPCIATDSQGGGVRFLSENGKYLKMIPVNDIDALSDAMRVFLEHPEVAEQYGEKAKTKARDFQYQKVFKQWVDIISI